jgi:hypothetical protein
MLAKLTIWRNHFEYHAQRRRRIPDTVPNILSPDERRCIAGCLAIFQLGAQSPGRHLLRAAYRFAHRHDCIEVARIVELLVREQDQHAAMLRTFGAGHAIPTGKRAWTVAIFGSAKLELCLAALVSSDLVGSVYYRALERATGCQRLRLLCRILVADELAHIGFASDVLLAMRARKPAPLRRAGELAQLGLLMGSAVTVWMTHRPVLSRAGYGLLTFLKACRAQYSFYFRPLPIGGCTS